MADHLWHAFAAQVRDRPNAVALVTHGASLTWHQLDDAVANEHASLTQRADQPAFFIVHDCENQLADVLIALACLRGGLIDVPIDARLPKSMKVKLADRVRASCPGRVTVRSANEPPQKARSRSARRRTPSPSTADDDALLLWTSGTSGASKGVVLSNRALAVNAAAKLKAVPQTPDDVRLTVLPICHAYARTCDLGTWLLSGCTLAMDLGTAGWNRLAPRVRPTLANLVPSLAKRLLQQGIDAEGSNRLKLVGVGGAGLDEATFREWHGRGITVIQGYGLTETGPVICSATPADAMPNTVGRPVDGWETKIIDRRLHVRGPSLMNRYLGEGRRSPDEWFDTGDRVAIDQNTGQFSILGRDDDVMTLPNGYQVHPESVERALLKSRFVAHAFVDLKDDQLTAWIEPYSEAIADQCYEAISHEQRPRKFRAMNLTSDQIEACKTSKGNFCRRKMRELLN